MKCGTCECTIAEGVPTMLGARGKVHRLPFHCLASLRARLDVLDRGNVVAGHDLETGNWEVHEVSGPMNDTGSRVLGEGRTILAALDAAYATLNP